MSMGRVLPVWAWAGLIILAIWGGTIAYVHALDNDAQQPSMSQAEIDARIMETEAKIATLREQVAAESGQPYETWVFAVNELGWDPPDAYYEIEILVSDLVHLKYAAAGCVVGMVSDWDGIETDICIEARPTAPVPRMMDLAADIRGPGTVLHPA